MSLLGDILAWSITDLKLWQQDAMRRLFQKQKLDEQDYDDLYAMLRSANGLTDPQNRQCISFDKTHLPSQATSTATVILKSLQDLKDVNRIAAGQKLEFSKGITVIYGGNGTGKSGYSRVLKRACRARDLIETVYPDAFDPAATNKVPEATFNIEVDGKLITLPWKRDRFPPDELSTIAVFDSRCARAYLDEQDVAYLPYGLDIVENLGQQVLPVLLRKLNSEIGTINTDTTSFADLIGPTFVGRLISTLNEKTDPEQAKKLATLTVEERDRITELKKMLAESDPKSKAKALRIQAQRIDTLVLGIDKAVLSVNNEKAEKFKTCDTATEIAIKAEILAAEKFRSGESLLSGTGDEVWKKLFEAARRFSVEVAYPGKAFPNTDLEAQCPLCQQGLGEEAVRRMQRFEDFIKQDTAKLAATKRQDREAEKKKVEGSAVVFSPDKATMEELKQLSPALPDTLQSFEKSLEARRLYFLNSFSTHNWDTVPPIKDDVREELKAISKELTDQALELEKACDEVKKKAFEDELLALTTRSTLALRLNALLDLIGRIKLKASLTKCKDDLKTKAISDKAKEFANQAVTEALKVALNTEFEALGVRSIKTKLTERVEQGKMKHKLVLDLPVMKKLDEILSEGEQRAIAIGSFLAELHLAGHKGGIVFDDPVSSLDHHWRRNVVRRLVKEARHRQVIILTHDTVFLAELHDEIEEQKVDFLIHHLEWKNKFPGNVQNGLPWEHKSCLDKLDKLEKSQKVLEQGWPTYPSEEDRSKIRHEYGLLRASIEHMIEEVLFNGVVRRYRDWINVSHLDKVVGFIDAEFQEISKLYKTCCGVVDSHDPSSGHNATVPSPQQLGTDIKTLRVLIDTIKKRRKGMSP